MLCKIDSVIEGVGFVERLNDGGADTYSKEKSSMVYLFTLPLGTFKHWKNDGIKQMFFKLPTTMTQQPRIIWLISGYAGSGKDTTADILTNLLGNAEVTRDSFAGAVKDEVAAMYEFDRAYLDTQEGKARIVRFPDGTVKTVRELLIEHAESTKVAADDPAVWANRICAPNTPHWVLSDWRFLDELLNLRMRFPWAAFATIRVVRPGIHPLSSNTEHELDSFVCQYTIENSGSLLYIANQLTQIINSLQASINES
jgi:hypothetical protein